MQSPLLKTFSYAARLELSRQIRWCGHMISLEQSLRELHSVLYPLLPPGPGDYRKFYTVDCGALQVTVQAGPVMMSQARMHIGLVEEKQTGFKIALYGESAMKRSFDYGFFTWELPGKNALPHVARITGLLENFVAEKSALFESDYDAVQAWADGAAVLDGEDPDESFAKSGIKSKEFFAVPPAGPVIP
jgi:hypothetical protein